jgi:hypothetical protein
LTLQSPELKPEDVAAVDASLQHLRAHAAASQPSAPANAATPAPRTGDATRTAPPLVAPGTEGGDPARREQLKREFLAKRAARLFAEISERDAKPANVAAHLPTEIEVLSCRVGVKIRDVERLQRCTAALRTARVDEKLVLPFLWSEALIRRDTHAAAAVLEQARVAGLPETALAAMSAEQQKILAGSDLRAALKTWGYLALLAALAVALGCYALARFVRRKARSEAPA